MELKYVWIKEFRNLKNFGINFSHTGSHQFEYHEKTSVLELIPNVPSSISYGDNITSLTAIAGKNGSGKSSLCLLMTKLLGELTRQEGDDADEEFFTFNGIIVFGNQIFIHHVDKFSSNASMLQAAGYQIIATYGGLKERIVKYSFLDGIIYYSQNLDLKSFDIKFENYRDISTVSMLGRALVDASNFINQKLIDPQGQLPELKFYSQYASFSAEEHNRNVMTVCLEKNVLIPFTEDRYFYLKSSYSGNNTFLSVSVDLRSKYQNNENLIQDKRKEENVIFDKYLPKKNFYFEPGMYLNINKTNRINAALELYESNLKVLPVGLDSVKKEELIRKLKDLLWYCRDHPFENDVLSQLINNKQDNSDWRIELLTFEFSIGAKTQLLEFLELEKVLLKPEHLYYRMSNVQIAPDFSTGEYSLLTFFSRIKMAVDELKNGKRSGINNIILFLDEPDAAFHPEWSRKTVKFLTDFLREEFPTLSFQIIITTHSPYILSDVPAGNVRLLDTKKSPNKPIRPEKETFGANIHDLLADSFFMEDGFMGEFAKQKIVSLMDWLEAKKKYKRKPKNPDQWDEEKAKQFNEQIGEPLLKDSLRELYISAMTTDDIDLEIKRLEQERNKRK